MEEIHTGSEARPKPKQSRTTLYNDFIAIWRFIFNWLIRIITGIEQPNFLRWGYGNNQRSKVGIGAYICIHYKCPLTCWPRIHKSQPLIRNLSERCLCIFEQTFGWQKKQIKDLHEIDIYVDINAQTDVRQLLVREDTFEERETVLLRVYERNMPSSFSLQTNFSGIFIGKHGTRIVENATSKRLDVVTVDLAEDEAIRTEHHNFDIKQAKFEIKSLLECVVFQNLIVQYEKLKDLYIKHFTTCPALETSFSPFKGDICNNYVTNDFATTLRSTIEQLLGEMTTMFKRSTLPKHKIPFLFSFEKQQVSKKVTRQLFRFDDTIRACGYSNSTFNVNVERLSSTHEETDRKKRIKDFLAKFGVTNVKFNTVSKDVSEYKYVGAEVITKKNLKGTEKLHQGTIGGFASIEQDESTCVLISRHLGMGCKENKLYVNSNGNLTEFGNMIQGTLDDGGYDIAAAKVLDQHASACDFQYKNSDNKPLPGKLQSGLENLPVHLWGAKSKPGFGIITIPDLHPSDKNGSYMQIEDREPPVKGQAVQRMASEGDSGAVICADDLDDENVNVIAMLIGSNNDEVTKDSPAAKGTYVAFPLQKGVELLQRKTNRTFSLKGVSNN